MARDDEFEPEPPEPMEFEITDVLDLHTFAPKEVPNLIRDYLDLAVERGYQELRIIHGKGKGVQRQSVRNILGRDPRVLEFADAPMGAGSWGATIVTMRG